MAEPPKRTVKDLLAESKDTSELMVDLAYAAVFFAEPKLAGEVDHLEELMGEYSKRLRLISILAARSPEDAEGLADVLHLAGCIEQIADAAVAISRVVSGVLGIPDALLARSSSRRRGVRTCADPCGIGVCRQDPPRTRAADRVRHVGDRGQTRQRVGVRPGPGHRARRRGRACSSGVRKKASRLIYAARGSASPA